MPREASTGEFRFPYGTALLRNLVENSAVPTFLVGTQGDVFYANRAFGDLLGYSPEEVVSLGIGKIVHPDDAGAARSQARALAAREIDHYSAERRYLTKGGTVVWVLVSAAALIDKRTRKHKYTSVQAISIDRQKRAEAELADTYRRHVAALEKAHEATEAARQLAQSLARHDALTGLPNRRVFGEVLDALARRAERSNTPYAVLIVDLDDFKPINDVHGHHIGDKVLSQVATRMNAAMRKGDTLARLGGDEFGAILQFDPGEAAEGGARALAERIETAVKRPIEIGDLKLEVGASIGIAISPIDGVDSATLLRAADIAMYRVKEGGGENFRFFEREMEETLRSRAALEDDVRAAVANRLIQPHYQPLVRLSDEKVIGFEILARWHDPRRGSVEPDIFIPIVEGLGLIAELTYFLLDRACRDALAWPDDTSIALNVSAMHLTDAHLPLKVLSILSETGFPPRRLEIEVTESALVGDLPTTRATLIALQDIGIKISLDDFGTGYSNLYNLRELRFDKIKIDRSFVLAMETSAESAKIVHSVMALAKSLGLPTIAEGIEHIDAMNRIMRGGGEYGQGYLFGKAVPADEATNLVVDRHPERLVARGRTGR